MFEVRPPLMADHLHLFSFFASPGAYDWKPQIWYVPVCLSYKSALRPYSGRTSKSGIRP